MLLQLSRCLRLRRGPLSDSEFVGGFEWRATAPANDGRAIAAGQRIGDLFRAVRTIKRCGIRLWILRARRHEEENCSTEPVSPSRRYNDFHARKATYP